MKASDNSKNISLAIKLLGFGAITSVAGAIPSILGANSDVAIGPVMAGAIAQTFSSVFSNLTTDHLKDFIKKKSYGLTKDLQGIYNSAAKLAFKKLKEDYLRMNTNANQQQVESMFDQFQDAFDLIIDEKDDNFPSIIFESYLNSRDSFWNEVNEILQLNDASLEGQLLKFLINNFPVQIELAFNTLISKSENRESLISFIVYLGEESLRVGKANQGELEDIYKVLQQIHEKQDMGDNLRRETSRVLTLTYNKLRDLGYDINHLRREIDIVAQQTAPRLPLYLPTIDLKGDRNHMLQFKAAFTTFIGRDKEILQLDEFVRVDSEPFRWLVIVGPGGIGKSRLALEYCQTLRTQGFDAGFIMASDLNKIKEFQPEKPTLIIIDYMAGYVKDVQNAVLSLYHRRSTNKPLEKPVRLLLLERSATGEWWDNLKNNAEVWACRFQLSEEIGPVLNLTSINENERWLIISEVYRKITTIAIPYDSKDVLPQLNRIDPLERPLFAFFIGIIIASGQFESIRTWNVFDLLENLLQREKDEFWKKQEAYEQKEPKYHENLLAIITLTQGLSQDEVSNLCEFASSNGKWLPEEPSIQLFKTMASVRQDNKAEETVWDGLQPDMLGEYYLLSRLEEWIQESTRGKRFSTILLQTAWNIQPKRTREYIEKILIDYPTSPKRRAYNLLLQTQPMPDAPIETWSEWGWLLVNGSGQLFPFSENLPSPVKFFEMISHELELHTEEALKEIFLLRLAQASLNLTSYFGKGGDFSQAVGYYEKLTSLLGEASNKNDFTTLQAKALTNLISDFGINGDFDQAENYYGQLINLLIENFENHDIAIEQAKASVNLTISYGKREAFSKAEHHYKEIETLSARFTEDPHLALLQANAAVNLTMYFNETIAPAKAEYYYYHIINLLSKSLHNQNLAFAQAQATLNISLYFKKLGDLNKVEAYYMQFRTLLEKFPNNSGIAFVQAQAALNLIAFLGLKKSKYYYGQIISLIQRFPDNQDLAIVQAQAAMNISNFFNFKSNCAQSEHFYNKIDIISIKYPQNQYIAIEKSKAALNLTDCLTRAGQIDKAIAYYQKIEILYKEFRNNYFIAESLALSLSNLISHFLRATKTGDSKFYYNKIKILLNDFPNNHVIAYEQSKVILNFTYFFNNIDEKEFYFMHFNDIEEKFNEFIEIKILKAKSALNLINSFYTIRNYSKCDEYYKAIEELAIKYPNVIEIISEEVKASVLLSSLLGERKSLKTPN